jgi:serine/threonine protein phosphatase PrpC
MEPNSASIADIRLRDHMEDRHSIHFRFGGKDRIFVGIYDGHGSDKIAECAVRMLPTLCRAALKKMQPLAALRQSYRMFGREIRKEFGKKFRGMYPHGGSCAANFIVDGDETIYYVNIGDTRVIVLGKEVTQLTVDHRISNKVERDRVVSKGAGTMGRYVEYNGRHLMLTRAFGDFDFVPCGILHRPHAGSYVISADDRFVLGATDGLFDCVPNVEILSISRKSSTATQLVTRLHELVKERFGHDNLTIVAIKLRKK